MKHLIPSLCLALVMVGTSCATSSAQRGNTSSTYNKNAETRKNASKAYDELDGDLMTTSKQAKSAANKSAGTAKASVTNTANTIKQTTAPIVQTAEPEQTEVDASREVLQNYTQPVIMVSPMINSKGGTQEITDNPNSHAVEEAIHGYLTKRNYEVRSIEGQAELNEILQMQNDIANTEDDLSYLAGVALDADIYIKFTQEVTTDEVSVEISAYEASTSRMLGSQTANVRNNGHTSKINITSNLGSATRKAMAGLEKKILSYWKMDIAKGSQYKVVANIKGEYSDSQTEDLHDAIMKGLKSNFSSVKVNVMTAKTLDFVIYASPIKYKDSQEIYTKIRQIFKPIAETKKINITRKLILMELN